MHHIRNILATSLAIGFGLVIIVAGRNAMKIQETAAHVEPTQSQIEVSFTKNYSSYAALRADSTAIVKVTTGEQRSGEVDGLPVTVTSATVTKVVWGDLASDSAIELRQVGNSAVVGINTSKLLEPGRDYLVFVVPSTGATDSAPNRYLIAGDAGLYQLQGSQYLLRGGNVPPQGNNSLPATLQSVNAEAEVTS